MKLSRRVQQSRFRTGSHIYNAVLGIVLLANAYHELADKDIHRVSVADLAAKLGFDSKNDEYLKVMTLKSLVDCTVEVEYPR